jgi:hypothetical protein
VELNRDWFTARLSYTRSNYEVRDRADNLTTLYLKVRCSPLAYEASVLAIVYDDVAHQDRDAFAEREEVATLARDDRRTVRARAPRNTLVFERLVGRNAAAALLGVRQIIAIGERDTRRTVRARWDALDDYTILVRETGAGSCGPCRDERDEDHHEPDDRDGDAQRREELYREEQRKREEGEHAGAQQRETGHGDDGHARERDDGTRSGPVDQQGDARRDDPQPQKPCGPTVVSETDIRGRLVLHVASENGRLFVME